LYSIHIKTLYIAKKKPDKQVNRTDILKNRKDISRKRNNSQRIVKEYQKSWRIYNERAE